MANSRASGAKRSAASSLVVLLRNPKRRPKEKEPVPLRAVLHVEQEKAQKELAQAKAELQAKRQELHDKQAALVESQLKIEAHNIKVEFWKQVYRRLSGCQEAEEPVAAAQYAFPLCHCCMYRTSTGFFRDFSPEYQFWKDLPPGGWSGVGLPPVCNHCRTIIHRRFEAHQVFLAFFAERNRVRFCHGEGRDWLIDRLGCQDLVAYLLSFVCSVFPPVEHCALPIPRAVPIRAIPYSSSSSSSSSSRART